jgi:hypothetical protein
MKKLFVIFLLLIIFLTQIPVASVFAQASPPAKYTNKCLTQAFSSLLSDVIGQKLGSLTGSLPGIGSTVPVKDDATQMQTKAFQFDSCMQAVLEGAAKIAMAKLKKKLMDDIVMQTTQWIQDDKEPKFITNYNDFLNESKDVAVENVMREIDLSDNPDKQFLDNLKEGLKRKVNKQDQVPLNKKVSNIATAGEVQGLKDDFIAGGGIAKLQELMTDQYPEYVLNDVIEVTAEQIDNEQTKQDKNTDGLARAALECQTWVLVNKTTNQKLYASGQGSFALNASGQRQIAATNPRALNNPPAAPNPTTQEYICLNDPTQTGVTLKTDPTLIKDVAKSTFVDQGFNSIISSDDLSTYIGQITDSVFFRFQKEGLRMFDTTKGSIQKGLWPDNGNYLSQGTYSAQNEVESIQNNQVIQEEINGQISTDLKQRTEKILGDASSSAQEVRSLDTAPMHRIKYLDWLLNATTTPTGGVVDCRINHPFLIGGLQQPYPDQIPLSSQVRPNNQAFLPVFNGIYTDGRALLTRVLAINPQTNAETIATLKNDVLTAENNIKTKTQDFGDFKTQLQSYITTTVANWPPCNLTSQQPAAER